METSWPLWTVFIPVLVSFVALAGVLWSVAAADRREREARLAVRRDAYQARLTASIAEFLAAAYSYRWHSEWFSVWKHWDEHDDDNFKKMTEAEEHASVVLMEKLVVLRLMTEPSTSLALAVGEAVETMDQVGSAMEDLVYAVRWKGSEFVQPHQDVLRKLWPKYSAVLTKLVEVGGETVRLLDGSTTERTRHLFTRLAVRSRRSRT